MTAAFVAVTRFGLGAAPGEFDAASRDPRGWVLGQLQAKPVPPKALADLPDGNTRAGEISRRVAGADNRALIQLIRREHREAYLKEAAARTLAQIDTTQPVRERLVAFWSNHFTVSVQRPVILGLAGPFEREAIRPHVTGKFADMLLAVARHQAMLMFLDQAISIGPNSTLGTRRGRGLNENLAREILELHTLGVDGGYSQADVTEFARILTGWSIMREQEGTAGRFMFRSAMHEPGSKTLLGRRFAEDGENEGVAALAMLARHPSTAKFIATKLARHFIADQPPPATIERLAKVFRDSDGDLGRVTSTLIDLPEAWAEPARKVKTPNEFVVSALRATGFAGEPPRLLGALQLLGQAPFAAPSPAGWPDTADQWIGPEAVIRRAEWAQALGQRLGKREPSEIMQVALGPGARAETKLWAERAASAADAVALVFARPEFQRR